jgi:hypothetical protein
MSKQASICPEPKRVEKPVRETQYTPPRVDKTQKLAEVTGNGKVTGT